MKLLEEISEDEMVAEFLKAEINSQRWGPEILSRLSMDGMNRIIIDAPNLANPHENNYRGCLLSRWRGYKNSKALFEGFPQEIKWYKCSLERTDIERCKHLSMDEWNIESGGSKLLVDVANMIRLGQLKSAKAMVVIQAAESIARTGIKPLPILVARNEQDDPVVLEGHMRLLSYLYLHVLYKVDAIMGVSNEIDNWRFYSGTS